MTDERPQDVVARGYDAGAGAFETWQSQITGWDRLGRVEELLALLPGRPDVLELGSGAGVEPTRALAEQGRLVGIDISAEQVRRARERVPGARFLYADFTAIELEPASFDTVVAFYVLNHVPREELGPLLGRIARWLRPGGCLLASFGASDLPGWYGEWIGGIETFFSGYEPDVTPRARPRRGPGCRPGGAGDDPRARGRRDLPLGAGIQAEAGVVPRASYPEPMIACALCGRTMLLGEAYEHWRADGAGSEQVVCRLCEDEAEARGWARLDRPPERRTTLGSTWHARKVA